MQNALKAFYIHENDLIKAITKSGKDPWGKDYEYAVSVHIKRLFEKIHNKPFTITFELNNKSNIPVGNLNSTPEETINILTKFLKKDTPVDFGLLPGIPGNFEKYAYPFQVKKFISGSRVDFVRKFASFINQKANRYRTSNISLILIPQLVNDERDLRLEKFPIPIKELISYLSINENSVSSILIFELINGKPKLTKIWPNYGIYK